MSLKAPNMFFGHLPAGFLLSHCAFKKATKSRFKNRTVALYFVPGLLGSILPDFDLAYAWFVDPLKQNHHHYWTHIPIFWILIWLGFGLIAWLFKKRGVFLATTILVSNALLHLFLDTIVGNIKWLYPFSNEFFAFFEVPERFAVKPLNFIFHWTFGFEVLLITAAAVLFRDSGYSARISKWLKRHVSPRRRLLLTREG